MDGKQHEQEAQKPVMKAPAELDRETHEQIGLVDAAIASRVAERTTIQETIAALRDDRRALIRRLPRAERGQYATKKKETTSED